VQAESMQADAGPTAQMQEVNPPLSLWSAYLRSLFSVGWWFAKESPLLHARLKVKHTINH